MQQHFNLNLAHLEKPPVIGDEALSAEVERSRYVDRVRSRDSVASTQVRCYLNNRLGNAPDHKVGKRK